MGDFQQLNNAAQSGDPNFVVQMAVGPLAPQLVPQQHGSGAILRSMFLQQETRYILKKAHMSPVDLRVFDADGRLVAVSHHFGKNPYAGLDPLGLSPNMPLGEWKSMLQITGRQGLPSFKIRPKALSRHGRQMIMELSHGQPGGHTFFNVAKQSRLSTMSIRHNFEVSKGDGDDPLYVVECDLAGRTMNIVNPAGETCIYIQKSVKTMLLNAALGAGSELIIDVAAGVDWTAAIAVVYGIQQVGAHWAKDAVSNFVWNPLQNEAMDAVGSATGTSGMINSATHMTGQAQHFARLCQRVQSEFFA